MQAFLVETKQEYTTQLVNILTPFIYEGLQSIYKTIKDISVCNILRNFQCSMKEIPKWNNTMICNETDRIMSNSKSCLWLLDLIKATLKSNIIILTYNPSVKTQYNIDTSLYQNIKIEDFIHKVYIECARMIWTSPYLFYHDYPPIELNRNQRETIILIKECIKEAIRKLLPVKHILQIYLGEDMIDDVPEINFENTISEVEGKNLDKLIKKDLYDTKKVNVKNYNNDSIELNTKSLHVKKDNLIEVDQLNSNKESENTKSSDNEMSNNKTDYNKTDDNKTDDNKTDDNKTDDNKTDNNKINNNKIDDNKTDDSETNDSIGIKILDIINNIKLTENVKLSDTQIIYNELPKNNESETSIFVAQNNNQNYQEIFSNNSVQNSKHVKNSNSKTNFESNFLKYG